MALLSYMNNPMADAEKEGRASELAIRAVELVACGRAEVHHSLYRIRRSR